MTAATHDITIEQGATFIRHITWKDANGAPIDINGYTARMQVRPSVRSDDVLLSATTENGYIVLGGAAGTVDITIPAAVTAALTKTRGAYDLELVSGGGVVTRLIEGDVEISREVTR